MSGRCSRPQNSSPSSTKVGTPNTPIASAARQMLSSSACPGPAEIWEPRRIGAGFRQHPTDHAGIFDIELTLPEAFEDRVVIAAEYRVSLALRVRHAAQGRVESQIFWGPRITSPRLRAWRRQSM